MVVECSTADDGSQHQDTTVYVESAEDYTSSDKESQPYSENQDYILQYIGSQFDEPDN